MDFDEFIEAIENQELAESDAAMVGKMTVILGIANTLDAAHRQKFETIKTNVKNQEFRITVNSLSEGVLEKQFMERYQEFFEAMFGYKLILREKNQRFLTL